MAATTEQKRRWRQIQRRAITILTTDHPDLWAAAKREATQQIDGTPPGYRRCTLCDKVQPVANFSAYAPAADGTGLNSWDRECIQTYKANRTLNGGDSNQPAGG